MVLDAESASQRRFGEFAALLALARAIPRGILADRLKESVRDGNHSAWTFADALLVSGVTFSPQQWEDRRIALRLAWRYRRDSRTPTP